MIDLEKLALRRLLDTKDNDLYSKLQSCYFSGINVTVYTKISSYYKANVELPSSDQFLAIRKDSVLQEYVQNQLLSDDNKSDNISNDFLVAQLQDYFIRDETISFIDKLVDSLDSLEKVEIVDNFQNHLLTLNKAIPHDDELYDVGKIDMFSDGDNFIIHPSGLSHEFDSVNGGFAEQELVLLGGRRGSGKSIISLNMAINRFKEGNTVAFFTIEMRYKEVHDRAMSIISGVPFLDIFKNRTTLQQKIQIARAKFDTFYKPSSEIENLINYLSTEKDIKKFNEKVKISNLSLKDNRLFFIDDESLTLNRIDHYCNMFKNKYPNFNMAVVDYLNIIKHEDQKDWKTQIVIADALKSQSRRYELTMVSPYQIDATGEARFAKGILDSADRSFNFFPAEEGENGDVADKITIHTTKIRNGKRMSFDVPMDWECVRINPAGSVRNSERPLKSVMHGSSDNEGSLDI